MRVNNYIKATMITIMVVFMAVIIIISRNIADEDTKSTADSLKDKIAVSTSWKTAEADPTEGVALGGKITILKPGMVIEATNGVTTPETQYHVVVNGFGLYVDSKAVQIWIDSNKEDIVLMRTLSTGRYIDSDVQRILISDKNFQFIGQSILGEYQAVFLDKTKKRIICIIFDTINHQGDALTNLLLRKDYPKYYDND